MTNASPANELMGGMGAAVNPAAPTQSLPNSSAFVLFLFEKDSVGACSGQPYGAILVNPGDQSFADVMMMSRMTAFAAVRLDQLDTVAIDMIDRADMHAVSADNIGMFLDAAQINHHIAPVPGMTGSERPARAQVALTH